MRRTILFLAAIFICQPAGAEMLLFEINHAPNSGQNGCDFFPDISRGCAAISLTVNGEGQTAIFTDRLDGDDVGIPYALTDPVELAKFDALFDSTDAIFEIWTAATISTIFHFRPDDLWRDIPAPQATLTITQHVPRLGFGLTGYQLTNITHTLDSYGFIDRYSVNASQTIRLYGVQVPEPATWLLMLCGCLFHLSVRRRR